MNEVFIERWWGRSENKRTTNEQIKTNVFLTKKHEQFKIVQMILKKLCFLLNFQKRNLKKRFFIFAEHSFFQQTFDKQ